MTFLLSEDQGLRELLSGMVVNDQKADGTLTPRDVGVWFGMPDSEIRSQSYPYITIDMIDVQRDTAREMRGKVTSEHRPYLFAEVELEADIAEIDLPIPVNIDYQVTTYSRHPRHDRQIMAQLMAQKLPMRFGSLDLNDGTSRRLDVLDVAKRDMVEAGKRLFMNAFTVRVSSEVAQGLYKELYKVTEVHVDDLTDENAGGLPGAPLFTSIGTFTTSV